ncbi:Phenylalanine--tRNA ligase beta subunit [Dirofilaria immitis]
MAFFVGWTYWVISCVITTALVIVGVDYLTPFFYEDVQISMSKVLTENPLTSRRAYQSMALLNEIGIPGVSRFGLGSDRFLWVPFRIF